MAKKKRPYSMAFRNKRGVPRRYLLSGIPAGLWNAFEARTRREHVAKRQVILQAVAEWTHRPEETVEEQK